MSLDFCYLCGQSLPRRGSADWNSTRFNVDHVPPKAIRNQAPALAQASWSPKLPVHVACHELKNGRTEAWVVDMHKFMQIDKPEERNQRLQQHLKVGVEKTAGGLVFHGRRLNALQEVTLYWAKAFHAFVYGEYLAMAGDPSGIPPFHFSIGETSRAEIDQAREVFAGFLKVGTDRNRWDGFDAWGGAIRFRCTWLPSVYGPPNRYCVWALFTPDSSAYRPNAREELPWIGTYPVATPPAEFQELSFDPPRIP